MLDIQDLHIRFRNAPEGREAVKGRFWVWWASPAAERR